MESENASVEERAYSLSCTSEFEKGQRECKICVTAGLGHNHCLIASRYWTNDSSPTT